MFSPIKSYINSKPQVSTASEKQYSPNFSFCQDNQEISSTWIFCKLAISFFNLLPRSLSISWGAVSQILWDSYLSFFCCSPLALPTYPQPWCCCCSQDPHLTKHRSSQLLTSRVTSCLTEVYDISKERWFFCKSSILLKWPQHNWSQVVLLTIFH